MAPFVGLLLVLVVLAHVALTHRNDHCGDGQRNVRVFLCLLALLLALGFALTAMVLLLVLTLLTTKGGP